MLKLKELRTKYGYTNKQMANMLNVSKTYYWQIENNKRNLSYKMALNISKIFNLTPDEIFLNDFNNIMH